MEFGIFQLGRDSVKAVRERIFQSKLEILEINLKTHPHFQGK